MICLSEHKPHTSNFPLWASAARQPSNYGLQRTPGATLAGAADAAVR